MGKFDDVESPPNKSPITIGSLELIAWLRLVFQDSVIAIFRNMRFQTVNIVIDRVLEHQTKTPPPTLILSTDLHNLEKRSRRLSQIRNSGIILPPMDNFNLQMNYIKDPKTEDQLIYYYSLSKNLSC